MARTWAQCPNCGEGYNAGPGTTHTCKPKRKDPDPPKEDKKKKR